MNFRVCVENGVIQKDMEMACPVDVQGKFTLPVRDYEGQYVKVDQF